MSAKLVLNTNAMQDDFFSDAALIGIVSALPAYRFCWLLNEHFDWQLKREGESDICLKTSQNISYYFALYRYHAKTSSNEYSLYQLKNNKQALLPELKQLDFILMIKCQDAETEAEIYIDALRKISEVQLAQIIKPEKLKNIDYLLV